MEAGKREKLKRAGVFTNSLSLCGGERRGREKRVEQPTQREIAYSQLLQAFTAWKILPSHEQWVGT